jgi:ferredoxin
MAYLITSDCTACGACLLTCPEHAIVASLPLVVREDRCTSCGECVEVCPADAVLEAHPFPRDQGEMPMITLAIMGISP